MPTFTLTNNDDIFSFDAGNDVPDLTDETIFGLGGDDSIISSQGDDIIYGGDGADTINSSFGLNFPTIPFAADGGDTVYGGAGDDVIISVGPGGVPSSIRDTVYGGLGNDSIVGNVTQGDPDAVLDTLYGGAGNDTIDGATGNDLIYGGAGNDLVLARAQADTTDGGTGIDTIDFSGEAIGANVVFNMETGATTVTGAVTDVESNINYENAIGTANNDTITGTSGSNSIGGGDGDDLLTGGENAAIGAISDDGSDTFSSGGGDDSIIGGEDTGDTDIDVLDYSNEVAGVIVTYTGDEAGNATGISTGTDTFAQIERIVFTDEDDSVRADADTVGVNLSTEAGNDFVEAGQGADSMDGGAGTDELSYQQSADAVTLDVTAGTGTGGNAEGDTFANFETFNLTDGNDQIDGSDNDETVIAQDGDDTVQGGGGADSLDGGAGIDTLSYADSAAPVTVDLSAGPLVGGVPTGTVDGGDGTGDIIQGFENVIGSAGDDSLTGNGGDNTLTGGDGADDIDGGDGADSVDAGAGNDEVDGSLGNDTLDGGADIDTYDASDAAGPVNIDLGNNTATGTGIGDDVVLNFEGATGTDQGDTITGDGGDNSLDGGAGNDTLDGADGSDSIEGGTGEDIIDGGAGDDSLFGGDDNDTIAGNGNDVVDGGGTGSGPGVPGDNDTLVISDVPVDGGFEVVYGGGDDEDGVVNILDSGGNTVSTITFTEIENIVCFTRGTMIMTPNGEVAIEDLAEGDLVTTRDNGDQPLRWIGSQVVKATGKRAPVMIKEGALGNDRDLRVSQLHRMLIADWRAELMFDEPEVLAAAKHLVNGDTIYVEENSDEIVVSDEEYVLSNDGVRPASPPLLAFTKPGMRET